VMFAGPDELLSRTEYAQPALFALEYGLAQLLRSWGIEPRFVMGHSIGEYVAACLAGVFELETGLVLIARRGQLMRQLCSEGKMLAVIAPPAQIEAILAPFANRVSIAAFNAPARTVLSGESGAIEQLKSALARERFYCRELAVSHGFHSALMTPMLAALRDLAAVIDLQPPRLSLFSTLHGRAVTSEVTDPNYWRDQAREPVQCAAGLRAMIEAGCELFIEMGPERFFSDLADEIASNAVVSIPTLRRGQQDWSALLETLAQLYTHGARIDWPAFQNGHTHRPLHLPPYPFQRQRHWYDGALMRTSGSAAAAPGQSSGHPLLGRRLRLPGCNEIRFETRFSQTAPHYLTDHRLFGVSLPPAASHLSMLAQAAQDLSSVGADCLRFEDLFMLRPLLLPDGRERDVQLILRPQGQGWALELASALAGEHQPEWTVHMTGLCWSQSNDIEQNAPVAGLEDLKQRCSAEISSKDFYSRIWSNQGGTGAAFRWVDSIWRGQREALCRATCPASVADAPLYRLHPGLIEAACQVLHCCETFETVESLKRGETFVPFSVGAFMLFDARAPHERAWCHAQLRDHDDQSVLADLSILNEAGELVARIESFCLRPITRAAIEGAQTAASRRAREGSLDYRPAPNAAVDNPPASPAGIARYLQLQCAELSGYPEAQIATDLGFMDLGLDSIIAMMLSNRIRQDFGAAIPVIQILLSKKLELLAIEIWRSLSR